VLAAWVNSLRAPRSPLEASAPRFAAQDASSGSEGFASQRGAGVPLPLTPTPASDGRPQPPATPDPRTPLPPGQFLPGTGAGMRAYAPPDTEFPVPYMLGGPKPKVDPAAATASAPNVPPPQPAAAPAADPAGKLPPLPEAEATADNAAPKAKRKPVKIDPALLERALMNRYTPPQ
jgi:hypothetical protein